MTTTKTSKLHRIVHGEGRPGEHHLIPEIHEIGWGKFAVADPMHLAPHQHRHAFEICLIVSGEVEWETQDASYVLRAGDLFVTQPDDLHWGRDSAMQPCTLFWIHVDEGEDAASWLDFPGGVGRDLRKQLYELPRQLRANSPRIAWLFQAIFDEHERTTRTAWERTLSETAARASLQQLIVELVRQSEVARARDADGLPAKVQRAIAVLRDPDQESLSNRQIAASVGTSVAVLNDLFVSYIGMSLTQFSLRERVRVARLKLRDSEQSVTDIANELGFSSSQHFATAFKKMTGISPTTYRLHDPRRTGVAVELIDSLHNHRH